MNMSSDLTANMKTFVYTAKALQGRDRYGVAVREIQKAWEFGKLTPSIREALVDKTVMWYEKSQDFLKMVIKDGKVLSPFSSGKLPRKIQSPQDWAEAYEILFWYTDNANQILSELHSLSVNPKKQREFFRDFCKKQEYCKMPCEKDGKKCRYYARKKSIWSKLF
jgi:hypothetical protein